MRAADVGSLRTRPGASGLHLGALDQVADQVKRSMRPREDLAQIARSGGVVPAECSLLVAVEDVADSEAGQELSAALLWGGCVEETGDGLALVVKVQRLRPVRQEGGVTSLARHVLTDRQRAEHDVRWRGFRFQ